MTKEELKKEILAKIDEKSDEIIEIGQDIFAHPELGYKEHRTSALVKKVFENMGLSPRTGLAITGVSARIDFAKSGPNVCIMGELDAVVCPGHRYADPITGAAHACGHNGQIASMLGVAMGIVNSGARDHLGGAVTFLGVPAEEYVELEYRQKLVDEGRISFFGGKQQLLREGFFDGVDMAMMTHMGSLSGPVKVTVGGTSNGFVGKLVKYTGREAHAGASPETGINALNAAMIGLMSIHAQRETFRDQDHIRVHPIITKGGDLVNVIPADVRMETYVRGKTMNAIRDASLKVNRAIQAGAYALGAQVEIKEIPGYLPRKNCPEFDRVFWNNAVALLGRTAVEEGQHGAGSSDIGDLMHLMPAIHPSCGGAKGAGHSQDFMIADPVEAYIVPAKLMAMTLVDLLWNDASKAREIIKGFVPEMTKEEYFAMWDEILSR
ncbi:MAG: amidohydrolase [Bacillota bacterium]|jgi:amidohydrolase